jgi:hypothetical protein
MICRYSTQLAVFAAAPIVTGELRGIAVVLVLARDA